MSNETVKTIEPEKEIWRNFAADIGGKDWFKVSRLGEVASVFVFNEINFGPHYFELGQIIGDAQDIRLSVKNCLGGDSNLALIFSRLIKAAFRKQK